jgi:nitrate/nitrite transport system ATP-binding protein
MAVYAAVDHIDKVFELPNGKQFIALKNVSLEIRKGEFISLIGHSGCGKSTLLNILAGLSQPSSGGVIVEGRNVTEPGPDRMVVFQNYSLLPWKTVRENIALAVRAVNPHLPKGQQREIVEHHIDLVGLRLAADKYPGEISGGMKQRVAIARALSIRPKLLLLDEPFGALDALTRGNLQDKLMQICQESQVTAVMVTHDVDEALLLSDRVVMLTNGPEARIGQILAVPIPRPRHRLEVVNDPNYYSLRNEMIYFLNQQKRLRRRKATAPVEVARHGLEKVNLELGFVTLTDCAPLVVAQEKGFFKAHGLDVTLSCEPTWKAIADGIQSSRLDGAMMVAGMPLAMTMGLGGAAPLSVVTSMVLSRNANAVTLKKSLYEQGVRSLEDFKGFLDQHPDQRHTLGTVHPASMQNLLLRYWLASGGIDPDRDTDLRVIPPAQMVANLKSGNIDGYCAGEPWNARAVQDGLGFVIASDLDIWASHPEKVLGLREDWVQQHPNTAIALTKALLDACKYCDDRRNRPEILDLLGQPQYLGPDLLPYLRPGFIDPYNFGTDEEPRPIYRYNQFYVDQANYPNSTEGLWILTQFARWGLAPFPKNYIEILERVYRVDLFTPAAQQTGYPPIEPNRAPFSLFDQVVFNPDNPLAYLKQFAISREIRVEEVDLDAPRLQAVA